MDPTGIEFRHRPVTANTPTSSYVMQPQPQRHLKVVTICAAVVASMGALAFASVPLYRLFCQVTGYGGTTMRAEKAPTTILDRSVTVRFDANVSGGLAWQFVPVDTEVTVKLGEIAVVNYRATNPTDRPLSGSATYNVVPDQAGVFFNKLACFCFTEQLLAPGQSMDMPVQFFVDPAMASDSDGQRIHTITLSYTFYPMAAAKKGVAETPADVKPRT
jgi:cytochrome c oxidase assembly protein subunit 11